MKDKLGFAALFLVSGACDASVQFQPPPSDGGGGSGGSEVTCDIDTSNDPDNCGACGRSCGGGECIAGECQAVVIAGDLMFPTAIGFGDSKLFVTTDEGVVELAQPAASAEIMFGDTYARGIVVDEERIYWADVVAGTIYRASKQGGAKTVLVSGLDLVSALAGDDDWLFTVVPTGEASGATEILRISKDSGEATVIADDSDAFTLDIAVDAENVYWSTQTHLMKVAKAGGEPVTLANGNFSAVAVDASHVYGFASQVDGFGELIQVDKDGTLETVLSDVETSVPSIASDGSFVYYASSQSIGAESIGWLYRVPVGGGSPTRLSSDEVWAQGLVVEGDFLYWAEVSDGTVKRIAL